MNKEILIINDIIQLCSGITHGRVFNGELYAQISKISEVNLDLHLFTVSGLCLF